MTIVRHLLFIRNLPSSQNLFSKNSKLHIKFMYLNWTRKQTFPNAEGHPLKCVLFLWMGVWKLHTQKNPNANHKNKNTYIHTIHTSLSFSSVSRSVLSIHSDYQNTSHAFASLGWIVLFFGGAFQGDYNVCRPDILQWHSE